jgi:acyl-CoA synthetase (AMP-forming)/AMP-acid ligase II
MTPTGLAPAAASLAEVLYHRACETPDLTAYIFLADGEAPAGCLTYSALDRQARIVAEQLRERFPSGERVLLLFSPGLDFVTAFFGCLYAEMIAVPVPMNLRRPQRSETIVADASPIAGVVASNDLAMAACKSSERLRALTWFSTEAIGGAEVRGTDAGWRRPPTVDPHALALLQYTSGSTASPKGVMVSHHNLLHNLQTMRQATALGPDSISVTWLPFYHDMGLIDGVLQPVYSGFPAVLMPPLAFLQRPLRWLGAISRYRATHSGGPDFAYELCVRKILPEQRKGLDLASWKSAYNGAEPVQQSTLAAFTAAFAASGFKPDAFYPCYGLAEGTLMVSGGEVTTPPRILTCASAALEQHRVAAPSPVEPARMIVGCGHSRCGTRIVIVDVDSERACPPDRIGEIWVQGDSVAKGYWGCPAETATTFEARLRSNDEGPFLRTGDLGFVENGDLFVTGRLKDLVIIRGRNYYPQEIERASGVSHPAARPGCAAAFTVTKDGRQQLVVVQEVQRGSCEPEEIAEIAHAVRRAIGDNLELYVHIVVLLRPASIPKTSSGKIQRQTCRTRFLDGQLRELGRHTLAGF